MKNLKRKKGILKTIFSQMYELIILLIGLAFVFVPYFVGLLTSKIAEICVSPKYLENWDGFALNWVLGFGGLFGLVILFCAAYVIYIIVFGVVDSINNIRACIKYTYMPLTDDEIKENNINSAGEYLQLLYNTISWKSITGNEIEYLYINSDDYEIINKQLFGLFHDSLLDVFDNYKKMNLETLVNSNTFNGISKITNFHNDGFIDEVLFRFPGVLVDDDSMDSIIYANYKLNEKSEKYVLHIVYNESEYCDYCSLDYDFVLEDEVKDIMSVLRNAYVENETIIIGLKEDTNGNEAFYVKLKQEKI